jgi:hypothetical protein
MSDAKTLYATDDLGGETYAYESLAEITEEMEAFRDSFVPSGDEEFDPTAYDYCEVEECEDGYFRDKCGQAYTWDPKSKLLEFEYGE